MQDGSAFVVADVEVIAYLVALRAPYRDGLYGDGSPRLRRRSSC